MNCADVEILICDYVDGTLAPEVKTELQRHLETCAGCAELAADSAAGASMLARTPEIDPPVELVNRILFDAPWTKKKSKLRAWLDPLLSPILQPRYAMSAAMTIVSFAMLAHFIVPAKSLHIEDYRPSAVWAGLEDRAYRTWGRAMKFYDNLKVVYQIQATLKDWQQRSEEQGSAGAPPARPETIDDRKLPVHALPHKTSEPGGAPLDHAPEKQN